MVKQSSGVVIQAMAPVATAGDARICSFVTSGLCCIQRSVSMGSPGFTQICSAIIN